MLPPIKVLKPFDHAFVCSLLCHSHKATPVKRKLHNMPVSITGRHQRIGLGLETPSTYLVQTTASTLVPIVLLMSVFTL